MLPRPPTFGKLLLSGIGRFVVVIFVLDDGARLSSPGSSRFSRDDHILVIVGLGVQGYLLALRYLAMQD